MNIRILLTSCYEITKYPYEKEKLKYTYTAYKIIADGPYIKEMQL